MEVPKRDIDKIIRNIEYCIQWCEDLNNSDLEGEEYLFSLSGQDFQDMYDFIWNQSKSMLN